MNKFVIIAALFVAQCCSQELYFKHAPSYIVFQQQTDDTPISSSDLHKVLSGPLGLAKSNPIIQSKSLLKKPKANVLLTVVTHKDQQLPLDSQTSFKVDWDVPFVDVEHMMNNLQAKFLDKDPLMLDLVSKDQFFDVKTSSDLFQSLPSSMRSAHDRLLDPDSFLAKIGKPLQSSPLNVSYSSDGVLLGELQVLSDAVATLNKNSASLKTKTPDLLSFTLTGLKSVGEEHGADSIQSKEAVELFQTHLNKLTEDLKSLYKNNVLVEVLVVPNVDTAKVRKTRSLMAAKTFDPNKLNLEIDWYKDYPASFNIVIWLIIILAITVFFVAYGIWNMNPNLESILYRVPQDELAKKIN
ncbi:renin receptor [Biomphalaria pfeifferi]|uniref:Renin receptor n=1 Tax=Biomphalaria pfeifferi TaxID=112525 RepID=A0AAD8B7K8_BIOPF|nr:renin receptor [Biomphalaria pfeifferi]